MTHQKRESLYFGKLAVTCENSGNLFACQQLANRLAIPCYQVVNADIAEAFVLTWRNGALKLVDREFPKQEGLAVDIQPRPGEQRSYPAPKKGPLALALGRKTQTIIDATTGWAQDSLHMFRMGFDVLCIERSPVMRELIQDGFNRLSQLDWVQNLQLRSPQLLAGNAIDLLPSFEQKPDCIYLDPMFPAKRKKSALSKKSMRVLRDLLGDDEDRTQLFETAMKTAGKRVVVKSPDYAEPIGGKPNESIHGKLLRYDIYLTH